MTRITGTCAYTSLNRDGMRHRLPSTTEMHSYHETRTLQGHQAAPSAGIEPATPGLGIPSKGSDDDGEAPLSAASKAVGALRCVTVALRVVSSAPR